MVLLPMTTTASPSSSSVTVRTAEVGVLDADAEMDEVIMLPLLSVVVTATCDVGVLLDSDVAVVPVASSDVLASSLVDVVSDVGSSGWSDVGVAEVAVVSSPVIVGPADVGGSSVVSVVVAGSALVVGSEVGAVVSCEVDWSEVVVSAEVVGVGATELLVVTPVPTTCRLFGMTP
jgi:hypothetical protein